MEQQSPGPLIRVALASLASIVLLLVSQFYLPLLGPVAALLISYFWIPVALLYVLNRSHLFGKVGGSPQVEGETTIMKPAAFVIIVFGPILLLLLAKLSHLGAISELGPLWWPSAVVLLTILGALVLSPAVLSTNRNAVASYLSIPLAIGSLIVALGSDRQFGYLSETFGEEVFDVISLGRWGLLMAVLAIFAIAVLIELVRTIVEFRSDFLKPWVKWREWYGSLNIGEPADTGALDQIVNAIAVACSIALNFFILLKSIFVEFLIVFVRATWKSLEGLFDFKRMGISLALASLIFVGLLIEDNSSYLLELIRRSTQIDATEPVLPICVIFLLAWMGGFTLAFSRFCYRHSSGIVFGYVVVMILIVFGIWLFSLSLHIVHLFHFWRAPGYQFNLNSVFFLEIALVIALAITVWLLFRAPSPAAGRKVAAFLLAYTLVACAVIGVLTFVAGAPAADQVSIRAFDGLSLPGEDRFRVERRGADAAPDWLYGLWGVDGNCVEGMWIRGDQSQLWVDYQGDVEPMRIRDFSSDFVATDQAQYTRLGARVRVVDQGLDYMLTPCG